jgi:iron complex transport system permease protein
LKSVININGGFAALLLIAFFLFVLNLSLGSADTGFLDVIKVITGNSNDKGADMIVLLYRLPQAVTALSTGIALGLAGLVLQTLFRNTLAGPSVLGISAGASFGVAVAVLMGSVTGGLFLFSGVANDVITVIFAFGGALAVLSVILYVSQRISNVVTILIIGIMTGYVVSALVSVMQFFSRSQDVYSFVVWGLGSFSKTDNYQALFLLSVALTGFGLLIFYIKPLNALLIGEVYARSIGFRVKRIRLVLFALTGIFIAATTAYTGPIGFIGLAVPHLARAVFKTSEHSVLIPAVAITGGIVALLCNLMAKLPGMDMSLPINAVTSLIGAPVVIWVLLKRGGNRYKG